MANENTSKWILIILACALVGGGSTLCLAEEPVATKTLILGAMKAEIDMIEKQLTGSEVHKVRGLRCVSGKLVGREVVVALTGVGKVNAAMTATLLIDRFQPREVLFTGIAGGINPELQPGDIVIGMKIAHHDYGEWKTDRIVRAAPRNPITGERNPLFIPADKRLAAVAEQVAEKMEFEKVTIGEKPRAPKVIKGIIVTGDTFISSASKTKELRAALQADAVEMEGAAVAQICHQLQTPCLVVRSISDMAGANANEDLIKFYRTAAANSAKLVTGIVKQLNQLESKPTEVKRASNR